MRPASCGDAQSAVPRVPKFRLPHGKILAADHGKSEKPQAKPERQPDYRPELGAVEGLARCAQSEAQHNCAEREQADRSLGGDDQMNLFPQRGEYLDCNFLNAASGSLVTPRVRRLKRNPLDKKEFLMTFVLPDRKAAK